MGPSDVYSPSPLMQVAGLSVTGQIMPLKQTLLWDNAIIEGTLSWFFLVFFFFFFKTESWIAYNGLQLGMWQHKDGLGLLMILSRLR